MTDTSMPWPPSATGLIQEKTLPLTESTESFYSHFLEGCLSGDVQHCFSSAVDKAARVESTMNHK